MAFRFRLGSNFCSDAFFQPAGDVRRAAVLVRGFVDGPVAPDGALDAA